VRRREGGGGDARKENDAMEGYQIKTVVTRTGDHLIVGLRPPSHFFSSRGDTVDAIEADLGRGEMVARMRSGNVIRIPMTNVAAYSARRFTVNKGEKDEG
jgi:hypothetical protein